MIYSLIILFVIPFIVFLVTKRIYQKKEAENLNDKKNPEVFHNDFSQVGSATNTPDIKPVDLSGNAIEHARETLNEDLENLGLDKD